MNFWKKSVETFFELLRRKGPHLRQIRQFPSSALGRKVDFDIYLPPDYHLSGGKRYPMVLFNDGQDLPRMAYSAILEQLFYKKQVPYFISVGIHASGERMREYGTARQPDYKGRGDKAAQYRDFILKELLPFLYGSLRLSGLREETAFAGFSLGGLSALDIAWSCPEVFGVSGVFSGSLWWRWSPVQSTDTDADRIMHDIIQTSTQIDDNQRFWFQCGTLDEAEDRNSNGIIDSIDDTLDLIRDLKTSGVREENIRYLEMEGGRHEPATWGAAMPDFLRWTFVREMGH